MMIIGATLRAVVRCDGERIRVVHAAWRVRIRELHTAWRPGIRGIFPHGADTFMCTALDACMRAAIQIWSSRAHEFIMLQGGCGDVERLWRRDASGSGDS